MKQLFILFLVVLSLNSFGQKKSEMNSRIVSLETRVANLEKELNKANTEKNQLRFMVDSLRNEITLLKMNLANLQTESPKEETTSVKESNNQKQCQAITAAGKQCSRNAQDGSNYCWQHRPTYEPQSTKDSDRKTDVKQTPSNSGRQIQTGPRGGQYYINSSGKKTYIKKK